MHSKNVFIVFYSVQCLAYSRKAFLKSIKEGEGALFSMLAISSDWVMLKT